MALLIATNAAITSLASQMARASPLILHSVHQMNHFNNCSVPTIQKRNLGILDIVIQTTIGMIKVCFCCRCNCTNHWTCWTSQNDEGMWLLVAALKLIRLQILNSDVTATVAITSLVICRLSGFWRIMCRQDLLLVWRQEIKMFVSYLLWQVWLSLSGPFSKGTQSPRRTRSYELNLVCICFFR